MILVWKILFFTLDVTRSGMATIVLQLPQAPWWWIVTAVFVICLPIQAIILVKKLTNAVEAPEPVPETSPSSATDQIDSEELSTIET